MKTIYLVSLLFLFFSGCKEADEVPITHIYVVDVKNGVCSKRVVTDKKTMASKWVADLHISACDGNVSLTMKEFLDTRTWLNNQNQKDSK